MATQTVSFNDGQMLLPSDRNMADVQPSNTLPSADGMACALGLFSAPAPLNPVLAEFGIADDLNALTTVTEYRYGASDDWDIDCDEIHCALGSFSTLGASMDVVTAEFSITEDLNTPLSVRKYEYDSSEGSDDDSKMDSDDEEGWVQYRTSATQATWRSTRLTKGTSQDSRLPSNHSSLSLPFEAGAREEPCRQKI